MSLKTANPEAFAEQSKRFKEAVKAASVVSPEAAMITAFVNLTTLFDEERTSINIRSDFAEMLAHEATKYHALLCPTPPIHVKLHVVSGTLEKESKLSV
jgi:hypothetical protein